LHTIGNKTKNQPQQVKNPENMAPTLATVSWSLQSSLDGASAAC
jgi:hypothetical protein